MHILKHTCLCSLLLFSAHSFTGTAGGACSRIKVTPAPEEKITAKMILSLRFPEAEAQRMAGENLSPEKALRVLQSIREVEGVERMGRRSYDVARDRFHKLVEIPVDETAMDFSQEEFLATMFSRASIDTLHEVHDNLSSLPLHSVALIIKRVSAEAEEHIRLYRKRMRQEDLMSMFAAKGSDVLSCS